MSTGLANRDSGPKASDDAGRAPVRTSLRRETVSEKAARLLSSGSVRVVEVDGSGHGRARVAGDHGRYLITIDEHGQRCTCPAWKPYSHALAVELVVAGQGSRDR